MVRLYEEYIKVNKEFIPVFDVFSDKRQPEYWKGFYPHESFIKILDSMIETLESASSINRKPIWIYGSYGTGKTFGSFTLKHILEESEKEVRQYFEKYQIGEGRFKRLEGLKSKGDILIVHRSASADITGDDRLFIAIQESVKNALKERDYKFFGERSLYDNILEKIKNTESVFNFRRAFQIYREQFTEYSNADDIVRDLEELGADNGRDLLSRIVKVAESFGFYFNINADGIISWLEDIIKQNKLHSIVFVWDEFTDYFLQNRSSTSGLQKIAEASSTKNEFPFYFVLITHKSHEQFIYDNDTRQKIEARFKLRKLDMADTTAFKLMRNAIEIRPDLKEEWENNQERMWSWLEQRVKKTINEFSEDIKNEDLKGLLPMHPFTSLLLQDISSKIGSDKRTMFQFLCEPSFQNGEEKHNFRWFIENNNIDTWPLLTPDYLWDYFFDEANTDLDEKARNTINYYYSFERQCDNEDETRILKVALLLTAIQQERGRGITNLLRPTLENITTAFSGTKLEDNIKNVMSSFVRKGIFNTISEGNDILYLSSSHQIDEGVIEGIEKQLRISRSFENIISDSNFALTEHFALTGYECNRFKILCATHRNIGERLNSVGSEVRNIVPIIFLYAKNEEDTMKNKIAIKNVLKECNRKIIIADISNNPLLEEKYNNFIRNEAKAQYFLNSHIAEQMKFYKQQAKEIIDLWKKKIIQSSIFLYNNISEIEEEPITIVGPNKFSEEIGKINKRIFPSGLESIAEHDSLFKTSGFTERVVQMGISRNFPIPASFSYLEVFKRDHTNIWENTKYFEDYPEHTISKMKLAIESIIEDNFNISSSVSIVDIWNVLKEEPFGLMPCIGSAFLLGFLLKEYANSGYYKKDMNSNNVFLSEENLANMIHKAIRGHNNADSQFIVKMTEEHELFCKYSGEIFRLTSDKQNSIQDVMKGIKSNLASIYNYPLWTLKYYLEKEDGLGFADEIIPIIDLYCEFISTNQQEVGSETKIAEKIIERFKQNAALKNYLKEIIFSENLKKGMQYYIIGQFPELVRIGEKIGINEEYLRDIKNKLSSDSSWLWKKDDIDRGIEEVLLEYKVINSVNSIIYPPVSHLDGAAEAILGKIGAIKMPFELFKANVPDLINLFGYLIEIYNKETFKEINKISFLEELQKNSDLFNSFYSRQKEVFKTCISVLIDTNLDEEEIDVLYGQTESKAILKPLGEYESDIRRFLDNFQKRKKYRELINKWKQLTGTDSPSEWSKIHRIPILCLFENETNDAQKAFEIINTGTPKAADFEIEEAIEFLTNSVGIKNINDKAECERVFKKFAAGEYEILFEDIEELKTILTEQLGDNVYDWFINKLSLEKTIKEIATEKYTNEFYKNVFQRIDSMEPGKVKDYLKELIKNEPLVGLKIVKNQ